MGGHRAYFARFSRYVANVTAPLVLNQAWLHEEATQKLFNTFLGKGYALYFVGGAVRNALMGRGSTDLDLATDALPQETVDIARDAGFKAIPTGFDHGTVTVVAGGIVHEITTFRSDIETDGRHALVRFSRNLLDDAMRRDFTMNAVYADHEGRVIDPLGGLSDLRAGRVVFVGDATKRIAEDHLRILRFFRFHALYGDPMAGLDPQALAACALAIGGISALSSERIGAEMRKLLSAPNPAPAVSAMQAIGALALILPGSDTTALGPLVHFEQDKAPNFLRRLAVLGGPVDAPRLRLSRAEARGLSVLRQEMGTPTQAAELAYLFGFDLALSVLLCRAAVFETPLSGDLAFALALGAGAVFPLRGTDLDPSLRGPQIGARLKYLEQHWIKSGFTASKLALLALA